MVHFENDNREEYSDLEQIISSKKRSSSPTNLTIRENCLKALSKGFSPQDVLYWAIRKECEPILSDLFLHYADKIDVNEPMFAGRVTPLHIIAEKGWVEAISFLHLTNANFLIKDNEGLRPLDYAYRTFNTLKVMDQCHQVSVFHILYPYARDRIKNNLDNFQFRVIDLLEDMTAYQEENRKTHNPVQPKQIQKASSSISHQTESGSQRMRDA